MNYKVNLIRYRYTTIITLTQSTLRCGSSSDFFSLAPLHSKNYENNVLQQMARTSTSTSSPSPMSATQAAASVALAALLARRRGVKSDGIRRVKRKLKPVSVPVEERERVVERNVRALKKAGRVGESEKEVRRRVRS